MNLYSCSGFRSVRADDIRQAAQAFALRSARRSYGRRAQVGPLNADCWTADGRNVEFNAFIGYRSGDGIEGRNVRFTVTIGGAL